MSDGRYGYKPIVSIDYSEEYKRIIRCVQKIEDEKDFSENSLNVITMAIRYNPENYNFWIIRRNILKNFNYDPYKELVWIEEMILKYPKNFLGWYHRKFIANLNLSCISLACELRLTECVLKSDAKNYFAYTHRQWAINTFKYENLGLLKMESKFTAELIHEDMRNNSAWSHRFFVVKQRGKCDPILVKNEMQYVLGKIKEVNANESAWNYLRGLLTFFGTKKLYQFQDVIDFCEHEYIEEKNYTPQLVAFLIDAKIAMVLDDVMVDNMINAQKIKELCMTMGNKYDKVRKNYWKYVYKQFYYDKIMKRRERKDDESGIKDDGTWKEKDGSKNLINFLWTWRSFPFTFTWNTLSTSHPVEDLNVKIGSDNANREHILERLGVGARNDNGERFVEFCTEFDLVIGGTLFKHKSEKFASTQLINFLSDELKASNQSFLPLFVVVKENYILEL